MKILCLGNEFIKKDSFAKKLGRILEKKGYEIINIKNSFQLIDYFNSNEKFIILDVVKNLKDVRIIDIDEISDNKIMSTHDFDAGFILKLIGDKNKIKIIGVPIFGNLSKVVIDVKILLG